MSKALLSSLFGSGTLRSAVVARLGCPDENVPQDDAKVLEMAKPLGMAPQAQVVEYTTKAGKMGAYLACDDVVPGGRFGGGGKLFFRLGGPDDAVSSENTADMRRIADAFADRSSAIHALVDGIEAAESDDS